jgi:hypothetical protein
MEVSGNNDVDGGDKMMFIIGLIIGGVMAYATSKVVG